MALSRCRSQLLQVLRGSVAKLGLSIGESEEEGLYLYANRAFYPGDCVICVQPYVNAPPDLKIACNSCLQPCDHYCSDCGILPFCDNEDCQRNKRWFHRPLECMVLQQLDVDTWKMLTPPAYVVLKLLLMRDLERQMGTRGYAWSTWEFLELCLPCHPNNSLNLQECVEMAKSVQLILRNVLDHVNFREIIDIFPKLLSKYESFLREIGQTCDVVCSAIYTQRRENVANTGNNGVDTPEKFACFMCTCSECQPAGIFSRMEAGLQIVACKFRKVCAGHLGSLLKGKNE